MSEVPGRPPESDPEGTPFLHVEPPPWAARGVAYVLLAVFAAAALAAVVITLPETVSSSFVLVPLQGTDPLRAPRSGVIARVLATEGQVAAQGDPLYVIQSVFLGDRAAEGKSLEAQQAGIEARRANARAKYDNQRLADEDEGNRLTRRAADLSQKLDEEQRIRAARQARFDTSLEIQQNEIDITRTELDFKEQHYALARELAERFERFHKEGAISWLDYNTRQLDAAKLAVEMQQLERALETARLRVNQLRADHEVREAEWKLTVADLEAESRDVRYGLEKLRHVVAAEKAEYRELERQLSEESAKLTIRIAALRTDPAQSQGEELTISAPCRGTMLRQMIQGRGAIVQEGETLGEFACSGGQLQAELTVPQSGIGHVKSGQVVRLLYAAFPYQRYGIKRGQVRWVSPASVLEKDTPVFYFLAEIQDRAVVVEGQARPLLPGMGGQANIVVGRHSLLSYAFEPIRRLRETLASDRRTEKCIPPGESHP